MVALWCVSVWLLLLLVRLLFLALSSPRPSPLPVLMRAPVRLLARQAIQDANAEASARGLWADERDSADALDASLEFDAPPVLDGARREVAAD